MLLSLSNIVGIIFLGLVYSSEPLSEAFTSDPSQKGDFFTEKLIIQPLSKHYTSFNFEFETQSEHPKDFKDDEIPHYGLVRRSLAQLIRSFDVAEMRLSFTRGQWDYSRFGELSNQAPAPGVELVAWLYTNTTHDTTQQWESLTHKLSGMFCATLATAAQPKTFVSPHLSFSPSPMTAKSPIKPFYAHLALESACTENLTPWLKLLPCRHYAGLAGLLKPHGVFDSHYSSMSLAVMPFCEESEDCRLKVLQRLMVVKPHHQVPRWDLSDMFKGKVNHACPLARESKVLIMGPVTAGCEPPKITLDPVPMSGWSCNGSASYSVSADKEFNLRGDSSRLSLKTLFPEKLIKIQRHMVDRVGLQGAFNITISNLVETTLDIALLQVLPWYLQPYLHTIQFDGNFDQVLFQPALDQHQASALELKVSVPPRTLKSLHIEFVAKFLTLDQYPPDPNRGFSIGPAVATVLNAPIQALAQKQYPTSNLLVFLPTPDFSMPYNVATFSSTVFALFVGSVINSLIRQFYLAPKISK